MEDSRKIPRVGVGVGVVRVGKVLLGKRRNAHGEGSRCFPGGHLEFGETPEECAVRETREETGLQLDVEGLRRAGFTNDFFEKEAKRYVTVFLVANWKSGEAQLLEPEKCGGWQWFEWNALPEPLFTPTANFKRQNPDLKLLQGRPR